MIAILSDIAVWAAFLGFVAFSLLYLRSNWRSTPVGRNAMALAVVCALMLGLAVLRLALGDPRFDEHKDLLRLICYGAVVWVIWWRVWILIKVQNDDYDDRGVDE